MLYFADVPTDTLRIAFLDDGGVPAFDVPQYWQRAAGFDDTLIAHAESKQRVKFAREQVVAAFAPTPNTIAGIKNNMCFFIFSLGGIISNFDFVCKIKNFIVNVIFYLDR